jgi:hypothetical protein
MDARGGGVFPCRFSRKGSDAMSFAQDGVGRVLTLLTPVIFLRISKLSIEGQLSKTVYPKVNVAPSSKITFFNPIQLEKA